MLKVDVSEMKGPLGELMDQVGGENGRPRFDEFKLWLKSATAYLRRLFEVPLGATDGTETFQSSGLFTGGIYGLVVPAAAQGKPTPATKATVWEMILDGMFVLLFGSLGANRKCWTESQVVRFCRDHRDKLRTEGYATLFEMEGDVVARVNFDDYGQLAVSVHSFSSVSVWGVEFRHRLVSLQLVP